jgi:hypothetical protein
MKSLAASLFARQDHPPDTGIMGQKIRINGTATTVTIMERGSPSRQ